MNEKLKQLAEQAGLYVGVQVAHLLELERFAELVRQDEREACAKLCETLVTYWGPDTFTAAIRARGEK